MERVALIPARGGSKRIPRKNIREFVGVPALARVVRTLLESEAVTQVVVSTDDTEIAAVAEESGATTPFKRPAELADSFTGARPVIQHAIEALELGDDKTVGVFYPTAVLTTVDDVRGSVRLFDETDSEFVLAVSEFPSPVQRALVLNQDGAVRPREPEHVLARSQDLDVAYHDIGQFYWGQAGAWRRDIPVVQSRSRAYVVDAWRAVDIDTPSDWLRAEMVFRMLNDIG